MPGSEPKAELVASCPLTPVLTRESMMRSFRASVSPCFILMRFLSRHFMAYLQGRGWLVRRSAGTCSAGPQG